jgi:arsenate reductase (thioredoxin)
VRKKAKILFLCTGNSCRSQMAEAWTRHLRGDEFEPYSAGVATNTLDPKAVEVMAEVGLDISGQQSKHVDTFADLEFEYVVTLCDNARESCPYFPAKTCVVHAPFDDPPRFTELSKSSEEAMAHYRRVRDEIRAFVEGMPLTLEEETREESST